MKLVLYSGGKDPKNHFLHRALADLIDTKRSKSITYVPNCREDADVFYHRFCRRYKSAGFKKFHFLPLDEDFSEKSLKEALKTDAIYLAGGNTFYLLHYLRKRRMLTKLRDYCRKGGVLAGLSAGAHVITPDIGLAGYPAFAADKNEIKLKNLKSLGLVKYEFFPHYGRSTRLDNALKNYSKRHGTSIIACEDAGGIVQNGSEVRYFGTLFLFEGATKSRLS